MTGPLPRARHLSAHFLANPFALERIAQASESCTLVAARPIYDDRGTLLWAQDKRITRSLHERLLERKLREPLETCLRAEDGFTLAVLREQMTVLLSGASVWAEALAPWAEPLLRHTSALPLLPSAQVLLTTAMATMPTQFDHAIAAAALAGAMQFTLRPGVDDVRLAMLGGLLHDVGDIYVNPAHLATGGGLSIEAFRNVVAHPRLGELVLSNFTSYPRALTEAVGQHHERHDGGGYPLRRTQEAIAPLGRLLAMAELALGIVEHAKLPFEQCAVAARVVPGEYDMRWVAFFSQLPVAALEVDAARPASLLAELSELRDTAAQVHAEAAALAESQGCSAFVKDIASRVSARAVRLLVGLASVGAGMSSPAGAQCESVDARELQPVVAEVRYRLRNLQRECMWPHKAIDEKDAAALSPLWALV